MYVFQLEWGYDGSVTALLSVSLGINSSLAAIKHQKSMKKKEAFILKAGIKY